MKSGYALLSFLLRGKRRKAIIIALKQEPKTPKQIATECKISISNVSNAIAELKEQKLVQCKNPEDHLYKFYELTKEGKKALKMI